MLSDHFFLREAPCVKMQYKFEKPKKKKKKCLETFKRLLIITIHIAYSHLNVTENTQYRLLLLLFQRQYREGNQCCFIAFKHFYNCLTRN